MRKIGDPSSLYFEERGTGLPIVNLHGWPGEHGQMMAMMEPLFAHRRGWRRIYVDLPWMGSQFRTGWVGKPRSDARRSIRLHRHPHRGPKSRSRRHSYGARLARGLMAAGANQIGAAFLLSPGGFGDVPEEAGPPSVFAESQQFQDQLTETEKRLPVCSASEPRRC